MVTKSLIQQRIALDRARLIAIVMLCGGLLLMVGSGVQLIVGLTDSSFRWLPLIFWTAFVIVAIVRLRRVRRDRLLFESEHGADAGKQRSV